MILSAGTHRLQDPQCVSPALHQHEWQNHCGTADLELLRRHILVLVHLHRRSFVLVCGHVFEMVRLVKKALRELFNSLVSYALGEKAI
jgi:hypothetical protein